MFELVANAKQIRILGLSGSLREKSYNTALLTAVASLAPDSVDYVFFKRLGELPLFNPDVEANEMLAVKILKAEVAKADGLIIASPEYARGISGVMKNALDWLVSGEEFPDKPIALFNASPRSKQAQSALRTVIRTMSGNIIERASIAVPLLGSNLDATGIVKNPDIAKAVKHAMDVFCRAITAVDETAIEN